MRSETLKKILGYVSITSLARDERVIEAAKTLVAYYYSIIPFLAFIVLTQTPAGLTRQNFSPLWPLSWTALAQLEYAQIVMLIGGIFLVGALCGIFFYQYRIGRCIVFFGIWQMHAFQSSFL